MLHISIHYPPHHHHHPPPPSTQCDSGPPPHPTPSLHTSKLGPRGRERQLLKMSECSCEILQQAEGPVNETPGAHTSVRGSAPLLAHITAAATSLGECLMMGDLGGGCLSQSTGGEGRGTDHALCSQAFIRMQVGEVRKCKEKRKRKNRWRMWRRKAAAGAVTHRCQR